MQDMIDGNWIRQHLRGEHGEKQRLAAHLGISPDKLSKVLTGARQLSGAETVATLRFFNATPGEEPPGLRDDAAT